MTHHFPMLQYLEKKKFKKRELCQKSIDPIKTLQCTHRVILNYQMVPPAGFVQFFLFFYSLK